MAQANWLREKRLLQTIVAVVALVPLVAGVEGVIFGPGFLHAAEPWPADLDSHTRYLSGLLLAMAIAWYSCIPAIESKTNRFRLLAAIVFTGGIARLISLVDVGAPSWGHLGGLMIETILVPVLTLWQGRIARVVTSSR